MSDPKGNFPRAYTFWIASLMFGLPLLTSFYPVQFGQNSFVNVILPYLFASAIIGLLILYRSRRTNATISKGKLYAKETIDDTSPESSYKLPYTALSFATIAVISYWLMTYFVALSYPSPSGEFSIISGLIYMLSLSIAVASGLPFILTRLFPSIRIALSDNKSLRIATLVGIGYFVTYLILVNQLLITSFNTPPGNDVPPPSGHYPFASAITAGPSPAYHLESAIYVPQFIVQINQYFNLIIMPFEFAFAIALSILVAASIALAHFLIKRSSNGSCFTGATVGGMGGFFGFTATCPSCLAPTLVSVLSGGVSATVPALYTNVTGVVLPPLVSIIALIIAIVILDYQAKKKDYSLKSLITAFYGFRKDDGNSNYRASTD